MPDSLSNIAKSTAPTPTLSDTIALGDSVVADSLTIATTPPSIALIEVPEGRDIPLRTESANAMSWVMLVVIAVFILVSLRYKNNFKYIKAIAGDLSDIRSRNNLFDDTVRETSLLISLNALCVISVALLFHTSLLTLHPSLAVIPTIESIGVAAGMTLAFYAFQYIAYLIVGNVFGDRHKTSSWIKGFASSQGLLSVILFPLSLITLFYPQHAPTLCIVGFIAFIIARLIFIFKGFRIFFNRISSFFLFLYYLCSLEIIPLILGYSIALNILENLI